MTESKQIAGRVFRLESHLLDQELDGTIDGIIDQLEIPRFAEEVKTLLRIYLSTNYVKSSMTAGMKVYNMNYCDASETQLGIPSRYKLITLTALNLTASYISRRYQTLENLLQRSIFRSLHLPWLSLDNLMLFTKSLNVVNFFIFLKNGTYLTLPERLLGLVPKVSEESIHNNYQLNRMQTDFMYREVVWKATAEFLTAIIPMINVEQIKNRLARIVGIDPDLRSDMKLSEKFRREDRRCAICLKQPFNPFDIGCRHVFCYYCLQSKYLSDPSMGYSCMSCKYRTDDLSVIRRYRPLVLDKDNIKTMTS
jgi:hypothetical protein